MDGRAGICTEGREDDRVEDDRDTPVVSESTRIASRPMSRSDAGRPADVCGRERSASSIVDIEKGRVAFARFLAVRGRGLGGPARGGAH